MICGHGGQEADSAREFMALAGDVADRLPQFKTEIGFLEFLQPDIREGLEKLRLAGCTQILVIPGTLFSAGHATRDIPLIVRQFAKQYPDIRLRYGGAFDVNQKLVHAACARAREAAIAACGAIPPGQTALLVVGRGAADAPSLTSMQEVTRHIQAELNVAHAETAYAGLASPLVPEALERMAPRSYGRVIVLPYFLFTGMLVKRIYEQVDSIAARYPATQFVKTSYLSNHPLVIDSFIARIDETDRAGTVMNG